MNSGKSILWWVDCDGQWHEYVTQLTKPRETQESLLELIDNFTETRHTCGHWTYNLKSNEARQKVIAALKGY